MRDRNARHHCGAGRTHHRRPGDRSVGRDDRPGAAKGERSPGDPISFLALSPADPELIYGSLSFVGAAHPFRSANGGVSWDEPLIEASGLALSIHGGPNGGYWGTPIAPHPDDRAVALATGIGHQIVKTTNAGQSWTYSGEGYTGGRAKWLFDDDNPQRAVLLLTDFAIVLSEDGGRTFRSSALIDELNGFESASVGALQGDSIVASIGVEPQWLAVSTDFGDSWRLFEEHKATFFRFIGFHPQNPQIIYAGPYKSTDGGSSWSALNAHVAAMHQRNGDVVYAFEPEGQFLTVAKSTNGGASWTHPYGPLEIADEELVFELAVDPNDENRIYLSSHQGIFIWDGTQWLQRTEAHGLELDAFGSLETRHLPLVRSALPRKNAKLVVNGTAKAASAGLLSFRSGCRCQALSPVKVKLAASASWGAGSWSARRSKSAPSPTPQRR